MSSLGLALIIAATLGVLFVPRRWAFVPLLVAALDIPRSQIVDVGALTFQPIRIVILAAFVRVMWRGERITGRISRLDKWVIAGSGWIVLSTLFHDSTYAMIRMADMLVSVGSYFLLRIWLRKFDDVRRCFKVTLLLLIPVALAMIVEKFTANNVVASLFGEPTEVMLRNAHARARGPYANAILAGTNGAVCLGLAIYIWKTMPGWKAWIGIATTASIVLASGASGPVMTAIAGIGAMLLWSYRHYITPLKWAILGAIGALALVMQDPVYYIVARIDIGGGSTGWYRAALFEAALKHLGEWWLVGTDATIHWMPIGTSGTTAHADITNHYIQMGVLGGIPLVAMFIALLHSGFAAIERTLAAMRASAFEVRYMLWTLGAMLFAHTVTFFSVSYFEPSTCLLFYALLAAIGGVHLWPVIERSEKRTAVEASKTPQFEEALA